MRVKGIWAWACAASVVVVGPGAAWFCRPGGPPTASLSEGVDCLPWRQAARERRLDVQLSSANDRLGRRESALAAFSRGGATLDETAARLRVVLAEDPDVIQRLRARRPGLPDEEIALRYLAALLQFRGDSGEKLSASVLAEAERRFPRNSAAGPSPTASPAVGREAG
jgi:hypothetical protein